MHDPLGHHARTLLRIGPEFANPVDDDVPTDEERQWQDSDIKSNDDEQSKDGDVDSDDEVDNDSDDVDAAQDAMADA